MSKIQRPVFQLLLKRLKERRALMQVLLGPRQIGKTTTVLEIVGKLTKPVHYISADLATLQDLSWIYQQWEIAREKIVSRKGAVLVIDEVQKIPGWSNVIKALWDEDTRKQTPLSVVILGSSPWLMQQGLTESLAGRFEIIPMTHWPLQEMQKGFRFSLEQFIYFGGYPGAAPLIKDLPRWTNYINDALIETTLSRDILLMTQINKPALLRRLFQLGCNYSGQIVAYSKMLGELQDAGNTTTLSHYLELLHGANLICGLQKYAEQTIRQKGSSPKFCVYNTALMSAQSGKTFAEAKADKVFWGRLVESAVGAYLLNSIRGTLIEIFYWREGNFEVDFVLALGDKLVAIEVKSSHNYIRSSGIDAFVSKFKPARVILVGEGGIPLREFLTTPIRKII